MFYIYFPFPRPKVRDSLKIGLDISEKLVKDLCSREISALGLGKARR